MHKLGQKLKEKLHVDGDGPADLPVMPAPAGKKPGKGMSADVTDTDRYRFRAPQGVNAGAWFCLERWLAPHLFEDYGAQGDAELDAVRAMAQKKGHDGARDVLEGHWRSWIGDDDFAWLASVNVNAIRVPIGYWHVLGAGALAGTPFKDVAGVYEHALKVLADKIDTAGRHGLGVLVDLHAVPGGANGDAHSGTGGGRADFFGHPRNQELAVDAVRTLVDRFCGVSNVIGVEVVNEPAWGHNDELGRYYDKCLQACGNRLPIYIGDAWDLAHWVPWVRKRWDTVVVDTHAYFCFSDSDKGSSPQQIIARVGHEGSDARRWRAERAKLGGALVVGEWSCVMDGDTWNRLSDANQRDRTADAFGRAQLTAYAPGGQFFWTYKFRWGDGGEWGFKAMTQRGALPLKDFAKQPLAKRANEEAPPPPKHIDAAAFARGWTRGLQDAHAFGPQGRIGPRAAWARYRSGDVGEQAGILAALEAAYK